MNHSAECKHFFAQTMGIPSLSGLVGRAILLLATCIAVGMVLMMAVHCLPIAMSRANVAAEAGTYLTEGIHPRWDARTMFTMLDNWTTMYMLEEAIIPNAGSALQASMLNDRVAISVTTNTEGLAVMDCFSFAVAPPPSNASGEDVIPRYHHGRFWHGYLLWLKPLLCIFKPSDLKVLSMAIVMCLAAWLAIASFLRCGLLGCISAGAAVFILNPVSSTLCPSYSSEFAICLFGMAFVFQKREWLRGGYHLPLFFFFIGCITSFFTFLTFPLPLLALPVAVCATLDADRGKQGALTSVLMLCMAFSGYASMWIAKWLVGSALTGVNLLADGLDRTLFRISGPTSGNLSPGLVETLRRNVVVFWTRPLLTVFSILALFSLGWFCVNIRRFDGRRLPVALCLAGFSLLPFIWIAFVRQHSFIHDFMVHKIFALSAFCILAIPFSLCGRVRESQTGVGTNSAKDQA